jgi:hypothetical protein
VTSSDGKDSDDIEWNDLMQQAQFGRSLSSIVLELQAAGHEVTRQDLANVRLKYRSDAAQEWLDTWSSAEADLYKGGDCGKLLATLFTDDSKIVVLQLIEIDDSGVSDMQTGTSPQLRHTSGRLVLKLPRHLACLWEDEEGEYFLYSLSPGPLSRLLSPPSGDAVDNRWCVLDQALRPSGTRPSALQPWRMPSADSGKKVIVASLLHSTINLLRAFTRCPFQLHIDGVECCNREGYTVMLPTGVDARGHNMTVGFGLLRSENRTDTEFMLGVAIPILLGRGLDRTCVILSDGNQVFIDVISSVIKRGLYRLWKALRRRCYFHVVILQFLNIIQPFCVGDTADTCSLRKALSICKYTRDFASTADEVADGLAAMWQCIRDAEANLSAAGRDAVMKWIQTVEFCRDTVFPGVHPGRLTFWAWATSPVESEHSQAKAKAHNASLTGMGKQLSTESASKVEDLRQTVRLVRQKRDMQLELSKGVIGVRHEIAINFISKVGQHLLHANSKTRYTIVRTSKMSLTCTPIIQRVYEAGFPSFSEVAVLRLSDDLAEISCTFPRCGQTGLPCFHVIEFNDGLVGIEDVHPMYLATVHAGLLDEVVHFSRRDERLQTAKVRVELSQKYPFLHQEKDFEEQGDVPDSLCSPGTPCNPLDLATVSVGSTDDGVGDQACLPLDSLQDMYWKIRDYAAQNPAFLARQLDTFRSILIDAEAEEVDASIARSQGSVLSREVSTAGGSKRYPARFERRQELAKKSRRQVKGRASFD